MRLRYVKPPMWCFYSTPHRRFTQNLGWSRRERVSANFGQFLRHQGLRHIRFHDLRHSAATNMHELTGDFYTVGQILGHSLKGIGIQLGISNNMESVTAQYVDVRLDRKTFVLNAYHQKLLDLNSVISIE